MRKRQVIVGMVGAGFAARLHAEAYRRVYGVDVELRAVTSAGQARAAEFARTHGIAHAVPALAELLADPEINLVDICTPNATHEPLAIAAAAAGKNVVVEKPLSGFFDHGPSEHEDITAMVRGALASADRMIEAARANSVRLCYAENWVYAPAVQNARRLLTAAGGTILRIQGEESHSGSHTSYSRQWRTAGGGSLLGKGCHPLGAALYLKYDEGMRRDNRPIRPISVVAEVGQLTQNPAFEQDERKFIQTGWQDVEDWGTMVVTFEDRSVAQITAADTVLGGIRNNLIVFGSRAVVEANINPNTACVAYAPAPDLFADTYISEKIETKAGWSFPSPDEDYLQGYPQEIQDFVDAVAFDREPQSGPLLARDVLAVTYAAYAAAALGQRMDLRPFV